MRLAKPNNLPGFVLSAALLAAFAGASHAQRPVGGADVDPPPGPTTTVILGHSEQDGCDDPGAGGLLRRAGAFGGTPIGVLYVNCDATGENTGRCWTDAFNSLDDALQTAATTGVYGEIWVARGTYTPNEAGGRTAAFQLVDGVRVFGGFVGAETRRRNRDVDPATNGTILSGDLLADDTADPATRADNSYHVVVADAVSTTAVLNGFTIVGGNADGLPADLTDRGAGILVQAASAVFRNCIVTDCTASGPGGGVYVGGGTPELRSCFFLQNSAALGAALYADGGATPYVVFCDFDQNVAGDTGGAICTDGAASISVVNSRMVGNYAVFGGAVGARAIGQATLVNCVIRGNGASGGGAMALFDDSSTALTNCTITANQATVAAGGVGLANSARIDISNTIIWNNTDPTGRTETAQVYITDAAFASISYSCVDGWSGELGGDGNLGGDPAFVDPDGNTGPVSLRLRPASPCIDAGQNTPDGEGLFVFGADGAEVIDLDGNPRYIDDPFTPDTGIGGAPVIDMGAYELSPGLPAE